VTVFTRPLQRDVLPAAACSVETEMDCGNHLRFDSTEI
jgi:hypothetical protein